jgi:hypothetical protein
MICPFQDFVVILLWHIRNDPPTLSDALRVLGPQDFTDGFDDESFATWCTGGDQTFNNGIKMVIWFIRWRAKQFHELQSPEL